ncbi:AAA family ATPase [Actinospica sp.]|uniref:AAA family ATPase n=1 Tax=Actinospica sp. TaxID=1872142 RepID=UPI002CAA5FB0|nr:MoxR family ATPase [Actinospica sp.]HWG25785.1 MoxR family ATPase [Actinospica sp.]
MPGTVGQQGPQALERTQVDWLAGTVHRIQERIETVVEGKGEVVRLALTVLLAEGHLLIEDVPGVGKTLLAKAMAGALDCTVRRIQFTPDLLPSDVTGVTVYDQHRGEFEFKPGAVFANLVVGDEINRASPKTQSSLLECMGEHQVTVDGVTHQLEPPFMVIATQNPIEMEGTYPLPEAQRDRFMARVAMGYPAPAAELRMLEGHTQANPLDDLQPVVGTADLVKLIETVRSVYVSDEVKQYVINLVSATREHSDLRLGASPRSSLHLVRAARAHAVLSGRGFVLPDDIKHLAITVLAHRLIPTAEARIGRRDAQQIVADLLERVPVTLTAGGHRRS